MSVKKFVCADLHLGHAKNALRRGFSSAEEHDLMLIERWNSVVRKSDIVYILGDITMEKRAPYVILDQLNGIKYVAGGNHDRRQDLYELLNHVNGFAACYEVKGCILTHIPIHPDELNRYRKNIHGHLHSKSIDDSRYVCVSLEHTYMAPIELDILLQ